MSLEEVAQELYGLPLSEFTAARNQRAKGDLAKQIKQLRKPATPAWVVNMLMRHRAEEMTQVLSMGESLRRAQADLDADALRELTKQRRQLTGAVSREGRTLAAELRLEVSEDVTRQVEETLHAAMIDEQAAAAVRSGLLVTPLAATGVGELEVADAVAVPSAIGLTARPAPGKRAELSVVPEAEEDVADAARERAVREREREQAEAALAEATAAAEKAQKKLRKATRRVDKLEARGLQLQEELEEVRRRAAELEHEIETVDDQTVDAEDAKERAAARDGEAQEALRQATEAQRVAKITDDPARNGA
jgi:hypothetical protein